MAERDPLKPNACMKTEYQLQALLDKVLPATCNVLQRVWAFHARDAFHAPDAFCAAFHAPDAFCAVHVRAHAWQPVACRLSVTPAGRRNGRTA